MAGPLHGYRVVDLTSMISGPLATTLLADQGADVIKVENPDGGDFTRAAPNRRDGLSATFLNTTGTSAPSRSTCSASAASKS